MSVLIRGMEMPKRTPIKALIFPDGRVTVTLHSQDVLECQAVPVPEHGRLIDADALRESIRESIEECHKWADEVDKDTMMYARISQSLGTFVECSLRAKAAPTIIPAEEEEG